MQDVERVISHVMAFLPTQAILPVPEKLAARKVNVRNINSEEEAQVNKCPVVLRWQYYFCFSDFYDLLSFVQLINCNI